MARMIVWGIASAANAPIVPGKKQRAVVQEEETLPQTPQAGSAEFVSLALPCVIRSAIRVAKLAVNMLNIISAYASIPHCERPP
jgi:hypothetical protein